MSKSVVTGGQVPGGTGVVLMARIRGAGGQLLTRASLSSVAYTVSDLTSGATLGSGALVIASVVFDDLQQRDGRWSADGPARPGEDGEHGYNFRAQLPASVNPTRALAGEDVLAGQRAPHRYQCDVLFTPVAGEVFRVPFQWQEKVVYG